jgi:hypothetical protein
VRNVGSPGPFDKGSAKRKESSLQSGAISVVDNARWAPGCGGIQVAKGLIETQLFAFRCLTVHLDDRAAVASSRETVTIDKCVMTKTLPRRRPSSCLGTLCETPCANPRPNC